MQPFKRRKSRLHNNAVNGTYQVHNSTQFSEAGEWAQFDEFSV